MKTLMATILPVLLWLAPGILPDENSNQAVTISEISYDQGVYYHKDRVFNGDIVDYYENNKLKFRYSVLEGRLHGEATEFYANGNIKSKRHYTLSKLFGSFTQFYESGEVQASFDVKLNAYRSGEIVENITIGTLKKGKHKTKNHDKGLIYFVSSEGANYQSSEVISILHQTSFKITSEDGQKVLIQVK